MFFGFVKTKIVLSVKHGTEKYKTNIKFINQSENLLYLLLGEYHVTHFLIMNIEIGSKKINLQLKNKYYANRKRE